MGFWTFCFRPPEAAGGAAGAKYAVPQQQQEVSKADVVQKADQPQQQHKVMEEAWREGEGGRRGSSS